MTSELAKTVNTDSRSGRAWRPGGLRARARRREANRRSSIPTRWSSRISRARSFIGGARYREAQGRSGGRAPVASFIRSWQSRTTPSRSKSSNADESIARHDFVIDATDGPVSEISDQRRLRRARAALRLRRRGRDDRSGDDRAAGTDGVHAMPVRDSRPSRTRSQVAARPGSSGRSRRRSARCRRPRRCAGSAAACPRWLEKS